MKGLCTVALLTCVPICMLTSTSLYWDVKGNVWVTTILPPLQGTTHLRFLLIAICRHANKKLGCKKLPHTRSYGTPTVTKFEVTF